ncbi:hypothetical protein LIER_34357 [Lithospermum erythrorhizon]|uniref:N-acetylglucosaminyldiphosphodolichol N-acetylglucosaminyltransferase n=1 Tax=Lithospermum erythrorhizon TaxID=34254 RepID=A0AAV3S2R7_LITER
MNQSNGSLEARRSVFVTVGTTSFDSLVRAMDNKNVQEELFRKGYTHLLIQMGRGTYIPNKVVEVALYT